MCLHHHFDMYTDHFAIDADRDMALAHQLIGAPRVNRICLFPWQAGNNNTS
jgi:hypothetical protein